MVALGNGSTEAGLCRPHSLYTSGGNGAFFRCCRSAEARFVAASRATETSATKRLIDQPPLVAEPRVVNIRVPESRFGESGVDRGSSLAARRTLPAPGPTCFAAIAQGCDVGISGKTAETPVTTPATTGGRERVGPVLVVDDDDLFRDLVTTILVRAGYRAVGAATGEEALDVAERERAEVVVLDIRLPGISGHEVCQKLRAGDEGPPVLFVSGERMEAYDRVAGLLVGGDDYLVKPFAPDELLARVHALIRRAHGATPADLTSDERNLVGLLRRGLGTGEIAQLLRETPNTVHDRVDTLFRKLGV